MRLLPLIGALALVLSAASVAGAQHRPEVTVLTPWLSARFAPPPWSRSGDLERTGEVQRQEGKTEAGVDFLVIEAFPKGENAADWTQRYLFVAESPLDGDFQDFVNLQVSTLGRGCTDAALRFDRVLSETERLMIVYCGALKDRPAEGEVIFLKMALAGRTLGKLSQHIRVAAFDLSKTKRNPPVPVDVLRAALVRVARMELAPIGR